MNPIVLKRLWIAGAILTILLALDGLYMILSNYKPDDTANNTLHMSDGTTVLVAAALMLVITIVAFFSVRRSASAQTVIESEGKR
jgi:amino acid transporter